MMRLGNVRISRLALVGDPFPFAAALGLAQTAQKFGLFGLNKGKLKRQMGGAALVKAGTKLAAAPSSFPADLSRAIGAVHPGVVTAMDRISGGPSSMRNGVPVFPNHVSVRGRRRRMNVLNPRALRRSITRVTGFARFARKTITIASRVKLKKRRRR